MTKIFKIKGLLKLFLSMIKQLLLFKSFIIGKRLCSGRKIERLKEGDKNSKYYHACIKLRAHRKVLNLLQADGSYLSDPKQVGDAAVSFFQDLFSASSTPYRSVHEAHLLPFYQTIPRLVSVQDCENLLQDPTSEEIYHAIQGLNPHSAPGQDGYTGCFFSSCWYIIHKEVVLAVQEFFKGAPLPKFFASTVLVLLPKVKNPKHLTDLRPISLCSFVSKILSIVLNDRMATILPKIISLEQCGFMKNRSIHENIALAHELAADLHRKVHGGNIMFKLAKPTPRLMTGLAGLSYCKS